MKAITVDCSKVGQVELFKLLQANKDHTVVVITDLGTINHVALIKAALDGKVMMRKADEYGYITDDTFEFTSTIVITYSSDVPGSIYGRMWKMGDILVSMSK